MEETMSATRLLRYFPLVLLPMTIGPTQAVAAEGQYFSCPAQVQTTVIQSKIPNGWSSEDRRGTANIFQFSKAIVHHANTAKCEGLCIEIRYPVNTLECRFGAGQVGQAAIVRPAPPLHMCTVNAGKPRQFDCISTFGRLQERRK